jgi:cell division protein FtsQ
MRVNWNILKLLGLISCTTVLYAFSEVRSSNRKIQEVHIAFEEGDNFYLSENTVNKLLIQKYGPLLNTPKEGVVLNTIESVLQTCDMVKSAQVYLTVDGDLYTKITQRQPIGRVVGVHPFYLDDEGMKMPLSPSHSARVPIITGEITGKTLEDAYVILNFINQDPFLSKNVIGIHIEGESNYHLKFRMEHFLVRLGDISDLDEKFKNFKAFYAQATQENTLMSYQVVSLEFNNQVVCTKI